ACRRARAAHRAALRSRSQMDRAPAPAPERGPRTFLGRKKGRAVMRTLRIALMLALTLAVVSPEADAQSKSFTEWGWPQPYEQVSPKSVEWLKSKGWWPLTYAYQPLWL